MAVHVRYVVAVVRTTVVPKYCVIVHHSYWVQLWAPRAVGKLSSPALYRLRTNENQNETKRRKCLNLKQKSTEKEAHLRNPKTYKIFVVGES